MKQTIFTLALLFFSTFGKAQSVEVKANPFRPFSGSYDLTLEYVFKNGPSRSLYAKAWHNNTSFHYTMTIDRTDGRAIGFRQYLNFKQDRGFFVGVEGRHINRLLSENPNWDSYAPMVNGNPRSYDISVAGTFGYKQNIRKRFTMETWIAGGYLLRNGTPGGKVFEPESFAGFTVGYRLN